MNFSHEEWVKHQKLRKTFRDVLLYFALIESIAIEESAKKRPLTANERKSYRTFARAIEILNRNPSVPLLKSLGIERNKLVHRIFIDRLDQKQIESIRDRMFELIVRVGRNQPFRDRLTQSVSNLSG